MVDQLAKREGRIEPKPILKKNVLTQKGKFRLRQGEQVRAAVIGREQVGVTPTITSLPKEGVFKETCRNQKANKHVNIIIEVNCHDYKKRCLRRYTQGRGRGFKRERLVRSASGGLRPSGGENVWGTGMSLVIGLGRGRDKGGAKGSQGARCGSQRRGW